MLMSGPNKEQGKGSHALAIEDMLEEAEPEQWIYKLGFWPVAIWSIGVW